ncbi:MAG: 50S ribosomal protein L30 [Dehalococcoidia bacterium]|nr:50S ribosomal protein L30 [Chloroflexota bacterium]MBR97932.1 50S ribosomal protein L30 [Dehalococcoidia bacterium]
MTRISVTLRKSTIGYSHRQRKIVQSLGLRRINHTVEHDDSESIIGMIKKVAHLVDVVELKDS